MQGYPGGVFSVRIYLEESVIFEWHGSNILAEINKYFWLNLQAVV